MTAGRRRRQTSDPSHRTFCQDRRASILRRSLRSVLKHFTSHSLDFSGADHHQNSLKIFVFPPSTILPAYKTCITELGEKASWKPNQTHKNYTNHFFLTLHNCISFAKYQNKIKLKKKRTLKKKKLYKSLVVSKLAYKNTLSPCSTEITEQKRKPF